MSAPGVVLWARDEGAPQPLRLPMQVARLTWGLPGGARRARLQAPLPPGWSPRQAAEWGKTLLRCPLTVLNAAGDPCWWGYVHAVQVEQGQVGYRLSLDDLANRIAATYRLYAPPQDWVGETQQTPWVEDGRSQALWGIKERLLEVGASTPTQALAICAAVLRRSADPSGGAVTLTARASPRIVLEGRGWWETLTWVHVPRDLTFEGFTMPTEALQNLGRSTTETYLAQSFRLENGPQQLATAAFHGGMVGSPTDGLTLSLCQDAGGIPGAVLASATLPANQIYSGRAWLRFAFSTPPLLQPGVTYWLRLGRNGGFSSTAYYRFSMEDTNPYPRGQCLVYNGSAWVARAGGLGDSVFYLSAAASPAERLTAWLSGAAGQFLRRLELRATLAAVPPWPQDGLRTCAAAIQDLLDAGSATGDALTAVVTAERALVITPMPAAEAGVAVGVDGRGQVVTPEGAPWPLGPTALGEWARLRGDWPPQPLRLTHLAWTPERGLHLTNL
ncbi:choice-of-anchor R domain-containing protein [Thermanaerothrix sp. 4228-RoL]|uniref:Choice-of-anchor R domain-containing protein n=1 Tax=Thermanaerothrix solaris TaxID=3058434 RepID=A0ABU3NPQ9_9CHLR|nr:choice-of-anchor R domain-containing protein [Thermanaerothrix sp. 4228-RoL]MDT8898360.1 choice-of-anchor R domain-containing protein [Thermanaerothrix sp. 4228-RoL]